MLSEPLNTLKLLRKLSLQATSMSVFRFTLGDEKRTEPDVTADVAWDKLKTN